MRRLKLDHADWHITLRGARRLLLFHDDADYKTFYALLGECCLDAGMGLIADCLMFPASTPTWTGRKTPTKCSLRKR